MRKLILALILFQALCCFAGEAKAKEFGYFSYYYQKWQATHLDLYQMIQQIHEDKASIEDLNKTWEKEKEFWISQEVMPPIYLALGLGFSKPYPAHEQMLLYFIRHGVNPMTQKTYGPMLEVYPENLRETMWQYFATLSAKTYRALVDSIENPNELDEKNGFPLYYAIEFAYPLDKVEILLRKGANPNQIYQTKPFDYSLPLLAYRNLHTKNPSDVIKLLMQYGLSLCTQGEHDKSQRRFELLTALLIDRKLDWIKSLAKCGWDIRLEALDENATSSAKINLLYVELDLANRLNTIKPLTKSQINNSREAISFLMNRGLNPDLTIQGQPLTPRQLADQHNLKAYRLFGN